MTQAEAKKIARERMKGYCRVCPVCNGKACAGEVPGMGGVGSGAAFTANVEALARIRLNMRAIHDRKTADTTAVLLGTSYAHPIQCAPMTGVAYNMGGAMSEEEFELALAKGSSAAGTLVWTGDGADPAMFEAGLSAIKAVNGQGIAIIKPRAQDEILARMARAEEAGVVAVGVDIDGAGLVTMALKNQPVGPKSFSELKELVAATSLPFIVKGIMTPDQALLAAEAGAAAIVVSNHGGRVLDHTPGAAEVLQAVSRQVRGRLTVFADGGVRHGADVLKLLCLGADGVLVGRPMAVAAMGGGEEGVAGLFKAMQGELVQSMLLTGVGSLKQAGPDILFT
ncbi:FMN-dependent alpha-hydroxy acid dehydrogenase [Alkalidesulfovibrio alkalitolerans DSM 16529]|jgi:isopentenyl diphosphate isomerase/L-lactate dehydrogenase-like FMN-dependent dehydrogenase|uniref:FMN-dependent alpha-hydroxy acid dehydrogenase n=1 Tax=Alkalidesulfovibrio alkalitolerans DSM 16529 TaxID=1121439 RepID=S7USX9_9BACT|nr:alpha-hydroxy-acid oxidizing protein [Alkalidesulfovibrio alkalitolerans]EPR35408.1 FMN-dependent alpha-hydroxy acid dehydrogenase [Alkalidesulfovibrio alkalitolerans DSM 16529]